MNTPNKLTVSRIILAPLFLVMLMLNFEYRYIVADVVFAAAAITDWLDGMLARKNGIVTDFGKFLDPLADKMLTVGAFLAFMLPDFDNICYGMIWANFIILTREFLVAGVRLLAVSSPKVKVIPANIWGKLKTVLQMVSILYTLLYKQVSVLFTLPDKLNCLLVVAANVVIWLSVFFTVVSGIIYAVQNKEFLGFQKRVDKSKK